MQRLKKTTIAFASKILVISYLRFSTPEQMKGDSFRRQSEAAEKWARDHGVELDDSFKFQDLGVSAYRGEHRTKALGKILELVTEGLIPPGSVLLIESLDRLSREEITEVLALFLALIRRGIKIVTLGDNNREYTKETINANIGDLIVGITIMARAHEESLTKSKRLSNAWKGKRQNIAQKKLTARCPDWLQLNEDGSEFIPIPDNCKIVERIFNMKRDEIGTEAIAKALNMGRMKWILKDKKDKTPRKRKWAGWWKSYIRKILTNRAVLGEFQPCTGRGKERKPIGEAILDYFPRIVSEELFYQVQEQCSRKGKGLGGRNGKISNLFGHLAKCGYCGSPMRFMNTGRPPKGATFLVCDGAVRGLGCERFSWRYDEIEELTLSYCTGLRVDDLLKDGESKDSELSVLNGSLSSVNGKLNKLSAQEKNLVEQIADASEKEIRAILQTKLQEILTDKKALSNEKGNLERAISKVESIKDNATEQIETLTELTAFMKEESGDRRIEVRQRLRHRLRNLIEKINFYPAGLLYKTSPRMKADKARRCLMISLKGGNYRILQPSTVPVVTQDYDGEHRVTVFPFINAAGHMDEDFLSDNNLESDRKEDFDYEWITSRQRPRKAPL